MTMDDSTSSKWNIFTSNNEYTKLPYIGTDTDKEWTGDFTFVHGSDPQFGMEATYRVNYDPAKADWNFEIEKAKLAVEKVNQMNPKPRFFIICGDMTNEFPGQPGNLRDRQIIDFKKIFSQVRDDIPLICVCGNHDVGDTPTRESIFTYRDTYGDDYFSFWCGGILFLVLNSQYYKDPSLVQDLADKQDQWLDTKLKEAEGKRIICFSHIPWFGTSFDEPDNENPFSIPFETRKRMLEKLYNAGVRYSFFGHYHKNGYHVYKEMKLIITSAIGYQLGSDSPGFRIVNVSKDKLHHSYVNL